MSEFNGPDDFPQTRFEIQVPESAREGHYANFLSVWHSQHDFTLDFAVTEQATAAGDGSGVVNVPCHVVTRVRIPVTVAEDVLRALAANVTDYENTVGRIRRPGEQNSD
jgi:hypothetical protein